MNSDFEGLIDRIYDVPDQPESLFLALDAIGRFVGSPQVHMLAADTNGVWAFASDAVCADRFAEFWSKRGAAHTLNSVPERELVDLGRGIGSGNLPWTGALAARVPALPNADMTALVVPLQNDDQGTQAGIRGRLQHVLPHLCRAMALWRRLDADMPTVKVATRMVRDFPLPSMLTDGDGRCIETNDAFTAMKPTLAIKMVSGRLAFRDNYLQDSWLSALQETAGTAVSRRLLADSGLGKQWKVHLQPIPCIASPRSTEPEHLVLAIFEEHAQMQSADPERLAAVSKLTPAELDVLAGLLQGLTGKVIAKSRNASVNTVRSQIMSILTKTGHHSQKELIASFSMSAFDAHSVLNSMDRV